MLTCLALVALPAFIATAACAEDTVVHSPGDSGVTVTYREQSDICSTAFDSQKQYTGWVSVPGEYPTNLFFWFVEARERTQDLTIWLNGGPGSSSLYGFFAGNGPCEVVETGLNEYETKAREWGWDRASNMLYIDQPNNVGFSYDVPTNGTFFVPRGDVQYPPKPAPDGDIPGWALINGTFSSGERDNTSNTTETAAMATWHMLQGFLSAFPQYTPAAHEPVNINLFAESYGGTYGPVFAETFQEQNAKRMIGAINANTTYELRLASLGLVNGCIDMEIETPLYPVFATENTYGLEAINEATAKYYLEMFYAPGGCRELLVRCREAVAQKDPEGEGDDSSVNRVCGAAEQACYRVQSSGFAATSPYDLSAPPQNPFPPLEFIEYLNQESILRALNSPINYTLSNRDVHAEFIETGDHARGGNVDRLAALVNAGVRVGLIYGDRDCICNWFGGEAVSKAIAELAGDAYATEFAAAGYAPIIVNDTYIGGAVRQYGNLSFSRVYQAGHAVAAYQPETAFQIFARILNGGAVSTGVEADLSEYATQGSENATETDDLPDAPEPRCYIRDFNATCDSTAYDLATANEGVVLNGVLYAKEEDWPLASVTSATTTTEAASTTTSTATLTGVYTATDTPEGTDNSGSRTAVGVLFLGVLLSCIMNAL